MSALENVRVELAVAAELAGVPTSQLENWMHREGLFRGQGPGHGTRWAFGLSEVFIVAAIRALVEDAGLAATRAVEAIRPYGVLGSLLEGRPFVLSKNDDGRWVGLSNSRRAELHIVPWRLWDEMKPRWAARFPAEVEEYDRLLSELHG